MNGVRLDGDWLVLMAVIAIFFITEMIVRVTKAIARRNTRPTYHAELAVVDPYGNEGKVTASFYSSDALKDFVTEWEKRQDRARVEP